MNIVETINTIKSIADSITAAVPSVIACASVLAALLPAPDGSGFLSKAHKAINLLAFNFGHAENK